MYPPPYIQKYRFVQHTVAERLKAKEQQTAMGTGRLENARKEWKSCSLEERERSTC